MVALGPCRSWNPPLSFLAFLDCESVLPLFEKEKRGASLPSDHGAFHHSEEKRKGYHLRKIIA